MTGHDTSVRSARDVVVCPLVGIGVFEILLIPFQLQIGQRHRGRHGAVRSATIFRIGRSGSDNCDGVGRTPLLISTWADLMSFATALPGPKALAETKSPASSRPKYTVTPSGRIRSMVDVDRDGSPEI